MIRVRNTSGVALRGISVSDQLPEGCFTSGSGWSSGDVSGLAVGWSSGDVSGLAVSPDVDLAAGQELMLLVDCPEVTRSLDNAVRVIDSGATAGHASAQHVTVERVFEPPISTANADEVDGEVPRVQIGSAPGYFPVSAVQVAVRRSGVA